MLAVVFGVVGLMEVSAKGESAGLKWGGWKLPKVVKPFIWGSCTQKYNNLLLGLHSEEQKQVLIHCYREHSSCPSSLRLLVLVCLNYEKLVLFRKVCRELSGWVRLSLFCVAKKKQVLNIIYTKTDLFFYWIKTAVLYTLCFPWLQCSCVWDIWLRCRYL